jgi:tripartite-type tricarboxylate transporter receptor subunit TctC
MKTLLLAAAAVAASFAGQDARAQDFYAGKTISILVGASVTGGYTLHARTLAEYLPRHIPGKPTIVVQNMPTAGGLNATNHLYNISPKDGTQIGLLNRYTVLAPLLGVSQALYKPEAFNWIGTTASYSDNSYLFIVRSNVPYKTAKDLQGPGQPVNVGNSGNAPIRILKEALRLNLNIIEGYTGDNLDIAFERGEVEGHTVGYRTITSRKAHWFTDNMIRPMVQMGRTERLPELPDVPTAQELASTPEDLALIKLVESPLVIGYPFAMPPGVPADRVEIIRKAFAATMADPEFKAQAEKVGLEYSPRNGAEIAATISSLVQTPAKTIDRYKEIVGDRVQN